MFCYIQPQCFKNIFLKQAIGQQQDMQELLYILEERI